MKKLTYHSEKEKSVDEAVCYSKTHESTHRYLAYRDIPSILKKYFCSGKALDYGTGIGYSANFLYDIGFDVVGVDTSLEMLHQAKLEYKNIPFFQVKNKIIPIESDAFDLVFSSFVLFEIGTQDEIVSYLSEAKRVMKKQGIFVAITGSQYLHSPSKKWINFDANFKQNKNLISGNLVKLHLYDLDMEFTDYYWKEADYRKFFNEANFELLEVLYPLGNKNEPYSWKDEITCSPFVILVAKYT